MENGAEENVDYVAVHRALGMPRYAVRFKFIQMTIGEAFTTGVVTVIIWQLINQLNLQQRTILGLLYWDPWIPFFVLISLPLIFSFVHTQRPDLKVTDMFTGAFQPTQFNDLPDTKWKPSPARKWRKQLNRN